MHIDNRCVAVVDILGFRERILEGNLVEMAQLIDKMAANTARFVTHWSMYRAGPGVKSRSLSGSERIHKLLFSDTLFLWSDPMPKDPERQRMRTTGFLTCVANLIVGALLNGLPLRAGVAFGPVLIDASKRIVIGQPVVDAYLTEAAQDWIGGAIHDSYPRYPGSHEFTYPVPTKIDAPLKLSRAIEWTAPARIVDPRPEREEIFSRIRWALENGITDASNNAVRKKYVNAAKFFNAASDSWESALFGPSRGRYRWPRVDRRKLETMR